MRRKEPPPMFGRGLLVFEGALHRESITKGSSKRGQATALC